MRLFLIDITIRNSALGPLIQFQNAVHVRVLMHLHDLEKTSFHGAVSIRVMTVL